MRRNPVLVLGLTVFILASGRAYPSPAQLSGRPERALDVLPAASDPMGWVPVGRPEVYQGEGLYEYIDGGAEIYHEYGFREVAVQDYKGPAGHTATLEVYMMASPAAAYGIYTFKSTGEGQATDWGGVEGKIEAYYLNLWRGLVLVTVTGLDESPETLAGVVALGRAAAAKLSGPRERPALVERLPRPGLRPRSSKYFRGRLGLNNVRALFPGRSFPFTEGVRGLYDDGSELFIFACESPARAVAAMIVIQAAVRADGHHRDMFLEGEGFTARDGTGVLTAGLAGRFMLVALAARADRAAELKIGAASNLAGR